ncbi:MAG: DUF4445 domain-containing protein [Deltaproteobacteria bacterium]|nr:DUF4445 domain-containing protein [Deltaproteobacteria bacterium]
MRVESGKTKNNKLGVAFDIGTTTIVGSLIDLENCKENNTVILPNPQAKWGRDILSRITAIIDEPDTLTAHQREVVSACNKIIKTLADSNDIGIVTAAGNSAMEHILLGISPAPLAKVPYRPAFKEAKKIKPAEIGIDINPEGSVYVFPLIGGFVGGDTVAGILSTEMHKSNEYCLLIDIGTNNETVVGSKKGIFAASTAAGPAFEGGTIKYGMIAENGAIQGIEILGTDLKSVPSFLLDVIGKGSPKGICGSGIIDCIAKLLDADIIDNTGRIKDRDEIEGNIANRIKEQGQGNEFVLYKDAKREITITQNDVREIQLAKGAIQAGIKLLLKKAGVCHDKIHKVFIAGAFGSNIRKDSLSRIGVIKKEWLDRVIFVGDAALEGAKLALCSEEKKIEAEEIAENTKYVSLSGSSHFQDEFLKGMGF